MNNNIPPALFFPKTLDHNKWVQYLTRQLTDQEMVIIEEFRSEHIINEKMKSLHEICKLKNLYVPILTKLHGDCLFESLNYHKIGIDVNTLRIGLSTVMYLFKNYMNFFPSMSTSLEDLFNTFNEIEYVYKMDESNQEFNTKNNFTIFKYSYDVMCQDLTNSTSWSKLPTQLILMIISFLYKVNIIIINNSNNFELKINVYENYFDFPLQNIYLGHLGESHYIPLDVINENTIINEIYYVDSKKNFYNWAKFQENRKINNYLQKNSPNKKKEETNFVEIQPDNKNNSVNF
ncbi:Hypothetical protein KVN_LOCUS189 [uncultured virus]|nr:Hypothetical protein KVN_LOCUS189 [uncultured virus]